MERIPSSRDFGSLQSVLRGEKFFGHLAAPPCSAILQRFSRGGQDGAAAVAGHRHLKATTARARRDVKLTMAPEDNAVVFIIVWVITPSDFVAKVAKDKLSGYRATVPVVKVDGLCIVGFQHLRYVYEENAQRFLTVL
ncbi:uncharacterized protein KRP23_14665 [Phytophthora ramorum]|uniref:uncharacterized protein n=1 Tax=Phytophthora ramorum TaxID=164328 RepID=UPI0030A4EAAC|nr:hypothetical protein KRP23_14665 [Phytophthora ramorum]